MALGLALIRIGFSFDKRNKRNKLSKTGLLDSDLAEMWIWGFAFWGMNGHEGSPSSLVPCPPALLQGLFSEHLVQAKSLSFIISPR